MELLKNIQKIKTTELGRARISRNLSLDKEIDPVEFCINKITSTNDITLKGKNWYIKCDGVIITVNKNSYTIITAHKLKEI